MLLDNRIKTRDWLENPACQKLIHFLTDAKIDARFVGGCVRDSLLGLKVKDIDLATSATPEQVMAAAKKFGIKAIPTGLQHGTVTLIIDHIPFEVTTLRQDLETDGRHARVGFTQDWAEDAKRRDLTINGLSLRLDGVLVDSVEGLADLEIGCIRFIGDPVKRIQEDYLRILRLFRFYARFGRKPLSTETLAAVSQNCAGLRIISVERIWQEMKRLLELARAKEALQIMYDCGVIAEILPEFAGFAAWDRLATSGLKPQSLRQLASLVRPGERGNLALRWKMSNAEVDHLRYLDLPPPAHLLAAKELAYRAGKAVAIDQLALAGYSEDLRLLVEWEVPTFPLRGQDVLNLGVMPGPTVQALLNRVEQMWIDGDFRGDRVTLLKILSDTASLELAPLDQAAKGSSRTPLG